MSFLADHRGTVFKIIKARLNCEKWEVWTTSPWCSLIVLSRSPFFIKVQFLTHRQGRRAWTQDCSSRSPFFIKVQFLTMKETLRITGHDMEKRRSPFFIKVQFLTCVWNENENNIMIKSQSFFYQGSVSNACHHRLTDLGMAAGCCRSPFFIKVQFLTSMFPHKHEADALKHVAVLFLSRFSF